MNTDGREPASADVLTGEEAEPLPWEEVRDRLAAERFYWLATVGPGGRPHVRPVLAVWLEGALYTSSNPKARKARNLAGGTGCAVTARTDGLDIVVEAHAARVTDHDLLGRVAETYRSKYGWPATVRDGAFDAPYGAPTAGPPPYEVYEALPDVVFGFGTDDTFAGRSTRWRF